MSSTMTEWRSPVTEINTGSLEIQALTFTANGEYLMSADREGVQVWRVEDGKRMAIMDAKSVSCLAVSKDGRWIAAGTGRGDSVIVWDAMTHKRVLSHKEGNYVLGVDFSPDSTRLVVASENNYSATVWDVATRKQVVGPLRHERLVPVRAAKYSPQGDRIATATHKSVRVWDSNDGRLLVDIKVEVTSVFNTGLVWSNDQLFIVSDSKIKQLEASTGSAISEWPVPDTKRTLCIALPRPQHGEVIAYSTHVTITFWDTSTHSHLGLIQHTQGIDSIAFSPDDRFLAIGGDDGKITINNLRDVLLPSYSILPFMDISDTALDSWKQDRLADTEASLMGAITNYGHPSHHALAGRALVRAHLRHWDTAIDDAKKSIEIRPSIIGYIAKSVALIGGGKKSEGCRVFDFVFRHCDPIDVDPLLLIKAVVLFMAGEHDDAISRVGDLIATVHLNSICCVVQAYMYLLLGNSRMENRDYVAAVQLFECARAQMRCCLAPPLLTISLISGWKFDGLGIKIRQRLCEALYTAGRTKEGGESLLQMVNTFDAEIYTSRPITKWVSDFTQRCLSAPERDGSVASKAARHDNAPTVLDSPSPTMLLREWAKSTLASGSWKDALVAAVSFMVPRFTIYRVICERLETIDRIADASDCFRQMVDELAEQTNARHEQAQWVLDSKSRFSGKLEGHGDTAMSAKRHDDAISQYSAALSLDPTAPQGCLIKRSKAYLARGLWEDALNDANDVIILDPSSPWGYERKHAALHNAGDYENAMDALETMLSKMSQSPDLDIRERHRQYVNPGETKVMIRKAVQDAIRESPRVLINTISGRLLDKSAQAAAFESLPAFKKLISSMTTHIDHARIEHDVTEYYRYAMFSHKWEENEPLFEKVIHIVVYDLEESLTHDKLQMFCKIVRDAGLHWARSDTCCINKANHFVLQEALVAMFRWYQGSAVTIVLLRGVRTPSPRGALVGSIWNTRAWTFQEYHASKVVRFYTEDWTPYMNLDIPNHKESPEIISEMEEVTRVSVQALMALRPGLNDIREKLCLASTRQTTRVEDAAYSLLGIFSVSLPIIYGEGEQSLGRLLARLLTGSGDTSILAWTGRSGSLNSCLPADISVFNQLRTTHIPPAINGAEMETITARLRDSPLNFSLAMKLYDRLHDLPVPSLVEQRMKLPCITFPLGPVSATRSASGRVFRAKADALGTVELKTTEDLSRLGSLTLVHPWIDFLLDRQPIGGITTAMSEENMDDHSSSMDDLPFLPGPANTTLAAHQALASHLVALFGWSFGAQLATPRDAGSLLSPLPISLVDRRMQALRLIARLRQPFGALLFTPTRQNVAEYRRVAAESMITVQVQEDTPLNELIHNARILDVL